MIQSTIGKIKIKLKIYLKKSRSKLKNIDLYFEKVLYDIIPGIKNIVKLNIKLN